MNCWSRSSASSAPASRCSDDAEVTRSSAQNLVKTMRRERTDESSVERAIDAGDLADVHPAAGGQIRLAFVKSDVAGMHRRMEVRVQRCHDRRGHAAVVETIGLQYDCGPDLLGLRASAYELNPPDLALSHQRPCFLSHLL